MLQFSLLSSRKQRPRRHHAATRKKTRQAPRTHRLDRRRPARLHGARRGGRSPLCPRLDRRVGPGRDAHRRAAGARSRVDQCALRRGRLHRRLARRGGSGARSRRARSGEGHVSAALHGRVAGSCARRWRGADRRGRAALLVRDTRARCDGHGRGRRGGDRTRRASPDLHPEEPLLGLRGQSRHGGARHGAERAVAHARRERGGVHRLRRGDRRLREGRGRRTARLRCGDRSP